MLPDATIQLGLFETPLFVHRMSDHEALGQRLAATILEMETQPERYRDQRAWATKFGALFESTFDFFEQPWPAVTELRDRCLAVVHDVAASYAGDAWLSAGIDIARAKVHVESWFHVTRHGGQHGLHKHPNASWSGVYFVRRGTRSADHPRNGWLRLHDPRPNISMYQDLGNLPMWNSTHDIEPEEGKLVVFPSWLYHEVLPYVGDLPRITVAFNVALRP
jgi:uncharacterized protein (TIGR02466 family)